MGSFKFPLNYLILIFQDYSARATDLDLQVERLSKEKKDYVEEIKVSFCFILCTKYMYVI